MGSKAKTPKAPNYTALAKQQAELQQQSVDKATQANRADQTNAFGSLDWTKDPTTGDWSQNVSLAPEYEAIRQQQASNTGQAAGMFGESLGSFDNSQLDFSGAPALPTVGGYNQQAIDTIRALQAPQLDRARAAKESRMAAMGLGTGSGQAWNTEQQNMGDQENRADMNAILAGIQQGNTQFGQGMQARESYISEALRNKAGNLQQLQALQGFNPQVQNPTFASYGQSGVAKEANLLGAADAQYQASLDAANAKNASNPWNKAIGIGTSLAGSYLGGVGGGKGGSQAPASPTGWGSNSFNGMNNGGYTAASF